MESYFTDKTAFLYNVLFSNHDKEAYAYQNHKNKSLVSTLRNSTNILNHFNCSMPKEQSDIKPETDKDNTGKIHKTDDLLSLQYPQFSTWKCLALQLALFQIVVHE